MQMSARMSEGNIERLQKVKLESVVPNGVLSVNFF